MRTRADRRRYAAAVLLLIALPFAGHRAHGQPTAPTRAPPGLDVSLPAAKRMAGARDFTAAGDWDGAIRSLELLTEEFGQSLIEVEPRRYVNVRLAAAATLATLPPAGLAAYRRRIDPALEPLYREAVARRDAALMRQIGDEGFASSVGDDALNWLAESALESGDIDAARQFWTAMLPPPANGQPLPAAALRYPDADQGPAETCARLVLCSLLQGDQTRTGSELASFERMFPDAVGTLAGRHGPLEETLVAIIDEAANWRIATSPSVAVPALEGILWSQPLSRGPGAESARLDCRPATWNDTVLIDTPTGLRALNAVTGTPTWPAGDNDAGLLDAADRSESENPHKGLGDRRFEGQVADGRWYGRRGSLISVAAERAAAVPPSEIACFDLRAEGRLHWVVGSEELPGPPGARFSGPPLVVAGRLFVAVRRAAPQVEIGMACCDAGSGAIRWLRPLCAALEAPPALRHQIHHDALTAGGGLVFQCPGAGIIAARAADSGELRWAVSYEVITGGNDRQAPLPSVMLHHGGRLFVKPGDSELLMALSAADGRIVWSARCPSRIRQFLGIDTGRLIAGGDHLWGFDLAAGSAWRFGFDDPEGFGFGSGVLTPGRAYWTTRDELFVVETAAGSLVERMELPRDVGLEGGNLAIAGGTLLIASPTRLSALGPRPKR